MISLLGKTCEEFQFVGGPEKCGECALRLMEEIVKLAGYPPPVLVSIESIASLCTDHKQLHQALILMGLLNSSHHQQSHSRLPRNTFRWS